MKQDSAAPIQFHAVTLKRMTEAAQERWNRPLGFGRWSAWSLPTVAPPSRRLFLNEGDFRLADDATELMSISVSVRSSQPFFAFFALKASQPKVRQANGQRPTTKSQRPTTAIDNPIPAAIACRELPRERENHRACHA